MLKKLMLPIMIVSIVIQLLVPVGMMGFGNKKEEDFHKYGKEFKVQVDVDGIYGGALSYNLVYYDLYRIGWYATINEDAEGYSAFSGIQKEKPDTDDYIRITWENKGKFVLFDVDSELEATRIHEKSAYIVVKVYKGEFEVLDLYMDGVQADEWLEKAVVEEDTYGFVALKSKES